jgi:hypothetical protein
MLRGLRALDGLGAFPGSAADQSHGHGNGWLSCRNV